MFYVIGLGLGDAKDVTVKGLEIIKKCDRVYLESYTSVLTVQQEILEEFYERSLIAADRELVENNADEILPKKEDEDVAFLVVGDPFGATTHTDLVLRAKEKNIEVKVIHNSSILTAVGCCGLQLYSYGEIVSIPYWINTWQPDSFYEKIASNRQRGLHTLCLLDIKVKEPTLESITKKKKEYMPPKFMSVNEAASQLITILDNKIQNGHKDLAFTEQSLVIGLARVGCEDQHIVACSLQTMTQVNLGPPLHCLVIPAEKLHPLELEFLIQYALDKDQFKEITQQA
ncbi:PREDICTED: diphthine methyl ester synthase [Cyphomyrmex costatus]|uniref:diphthine methyl ester synthase n=1 Tax=Cyphomyrmex costatus TaxID=456900 RepID=UPI00085233FE|nr:PREDICTED: diphthine methyl ester synthase [Cyphomyrmex costatus]XP_018401534.1 PREDICTED: diphthine methyl ester synthase [Cyphomyrmex costatus]XP_018401535.1 PREDICTED: diphthine methyl ester synthase [Cyphomyrmex costatus]